MSLSAPLVDPRRAGDVTAQVRALIKAYAPEYAGAGDDPLTGELVPDPRAGALIGIFGRFAELIIQRLNRVPDKNLLAFLDLLGASRLPPQPARVPLTFSLAAGTSVPGVVPAATPVAAPPGAGERDPIVFETERELVVTPATLTSVFTRDPEIDAYADRGELLTGAPAQGVAVFRGDRVIEHIVYFGQRRLLGFTGITAFTVTVGLAAPLTDHRTVVWEAWDGTVFREIATIDEDTTDALRTSGRVNLGPLAAVPLSTVQGIESRWLRCRLAKLVSLSSVPRENMIRVGELPVIETVTTEVAVSRDDLAIAAAFTNASPIDAGRDFLPFGPSPRFGDTFYLRADEPLSTGEAHITIHVTLVNPAGSKSRNPIETNASSDLKLNWETWNGSGWQLLGASSPASAATLPFSDGTLALTRSGDVGFVLPPNVSAVVVNGIEGYWIRVRIAGGDYGHEARYVARGEGFVFEPATFGPPVVAAVRLACSLKKAEGPDRILTCNDFTFVDVSNHHDAAGQSFAPFTAAQDATPAVYFGFQLPSTVALFPNRPVSIFAGVADVRFGETIAPASPSRRRASGPPASTVTHRFTITNPGTTSINAGFGIVGTAWQPRPKAPGPITLAPRASVEVDVNVRIPDQAPIGSSDTGLLAVILSTDADRFHVAAFVTVAGSEPPGAEPIRLAWEYWNGQAFSALTVQDGADNLSRPGLVSFLPPRDFAARPDFGVGPRYWLRLRREPGEYLREPRLVRLLLNTTMAAQTVTVRNEVLGSSDGSKNLRRRATRAPILPGQRLEVREPELPSAAEREALEHEEGADAIVVVSDARSRLADILVRWHEVPDFYASGPRDRHYVLDRLTGEIRFGDGLNGLVPPPGVGNLRLARYRTGGGRAGNRSVGTIAQLKTTVPYIDRVTNHEPATGGADAEPIEALLDRAPREVRHGGRAVTIEDFEDLAHLASPEVARAKCVPLADLLADPLEPKPDSPGDISVIVVPRSADAKPLPSIELIRRVQDHLDGLRVPTARLSVVGPLYVRVDVSAEVGLVSLDEATSVVAEVQQRVARFLHPLTGGMDGKGWDFGRRPHESDLYALIDAVPGVDHIRALDVIEVEDVAGATLTGRFLVYSGAPAISAVLEER